MANKKRIIIVDDDPDVRLTVKQILEKNGYKVYSFENGYDCLREMDEIKYTPALIILDIMMPEMSGWELHRQLEAHPALSRTPIVFLTARTTETAQEMYKRYGIEYITKPFDINELKNNIEKIIELKEKYLKEKDKYNYGS